MLLVAFEVIRFTFHIETVKFEDAFAMLNVRMLELSMIIELILKNEVWVSPWIECLAKTFPEGKLIFIWLARKSISQKTKGAGGTNTRI